MSEYQESSAQDQTGTIVGVSIGVILTCAVVFIVVPACLIVLLTFMGPSVDDVFLEIVPNI